ncbi:MAG: peptidoglycan DD-metalloendopeptidase family protein [Anaerolineae bacterium]
MAHIPEPPIHDEDTSPSIAIRPDEMDARLAQDNTPQWQQTIGWLSLVGALIFTLATLVLLFLPAGDDQPETIAEQAIEAEQTTQVTDNLPLIPTDVEPIVPTTVSEADTPETIADNGELPPIVPAQQFASVLNTPLNTNSPLLNVQYSPFTVVNTDRPRSDFINYTVVQGDTIDAIANRYGLQPESIAWCNDRRIILVLRPGDVLTIPPVDGACHQVFGTREETIAQIAEQYSIENPYTIIDADYNRDQLPSDVTPNDLLLGGTNLFIPGGEGPVITWDAGSQETDSSGNVIGVGFANGQPGSCGSVTPSQFVGWGNPLPNGTWVRGFYAGHSGLDLSASTGTPIYAASSGYVLFSGFSRWGYGNTVVLEHGVTYSTLYGHMSQANVSCGQFVSIGQLIGFVGSTGNSSGPHLHFEIQINGNAIDPSGTPGIGW